MFRKMIIGCDNAATGLKDDLAAHLGSMGIPVEDVGCFAPEDPIVYPLIAKEVCRRIIAGDYQDRGILVCGTGLGMCMCANKFKGIRAAVCHDIFSTERSILSNNGNVMCLGERVIGRELAKKLVTAWVSLEFRDGASTPKVQAITALESANMR